LTRAALITAAALLGGCWNFDIFNKKICDTDPTALCDDFEEGSIDGRRWISAASLPLSTLTVDTEQVHSGKFALHSHVAPPPTLAGEEFAFVGSVATFMPAREIFIRAFMFIPQSPAFGGRLATFYNSYPGGTDLAIWTDRANLATGTPGNPLTVSTTVFPPNQWLCVEWQIDVAPTQGMRVFVDGHELPDLRTAATTVVTPPFEHVSFGLYRHFMTLNQAAAGDAFYDDVVVSTQRQIGCGY
jgi:hypothetical protein